MEKKTKTFVLSILSVITLTAAVILVVADALMGYYKSAVFHFFILVMAALLVYPFIIGERKKGIEVKAEFLWSVFGVSLIGLIIATIVVVMSDESNAILILAFFMPLFACGSIKRFLEKRAKDVVEQPE